MEDGSEVDKITSDFQCFVCGAIFTTAEDRRQHLEKELRGKYGERSPQEIRTIKHQTELSEENQQWYEDGSKV